MTHTNTSNNTNMQILEKYAKLLVEYCLEIQAGDKLFVSTTTLAQPLVREVYRHAMRKGAHVDVKMSFREEANIFLKEANDEQLAHINPLQQKAMEEYDAYLAIRAPFNLKGTQSIDPERKKLRSKALAPINQTYFTRTADRSLKRSLCQYPTQANAQEAGMSLEEYQQFVFNACNLYAEDPEAEWLKVRKSQQQIVDFLNQADLITYKSAKTNISFRVKDRIWMNSDGQTNMPSGEVYTAPIEDSVNGVVHFDYPSVYMGQEVRNITLWVENGIVVKWEAEQGQALLDKVMKIDGANRFGEVAIGTNYNIQRATKNILFDEKIGGTIHMAVGQAYKQTGGTNQSAIHWDMISDMKNGGEIIVDGKVVYRDGAFIIF